MTAAVKVAARVTNFSLSRGESLIFHFIALPSLSLVVGDNASLIQLVEQLYQPPFWLRHCRWLSHVLHL